MTGRIFFGVLLVTGLAVSASAGTWLYLTPEGAWVSPEIPATDDPEQILSIPAGAQQIWVENEGALDAWARHRGALLSELSLKPVEGR